MNKFITAVWISLSMTACGGGGTDIHTLAWQMGTSVVMLEQHYSKLSATMAAGRLAG